MKIYCDESGGKNDGLFVVCATPEISNNTARELKKIKKLLKISDELKGSKLSLENRGLLRGYLYEKDIRSSSATLDIRDSHHSMILRTYPEKKLWEELIYQAVLDVFEDSQRVLTVVIDRGRYSYKDEKAIAERLKERFCQTLQINNVIVELQRSHEVAGLQFADIFANWMFRYLRSRENVEFENIDRKGHVAFANPYHAYEELLLESK